MKGYHVVFDKVNSAVLKEFELKTPAEDDVTVKINYTLISAGTEKAALSGAPNTPRKFPSIPGYSGVGTVVATGSKAKKYKPGDRVFVEYGGHASVCCKKESAIVKIPNEVSDVDAVFTKVASFPLLGLRRARVEIGESVVIVGLGMLGLFGVQIARACGALPLIGVGNRAIRQQKAREFGADYVFSPDEKDIVKKIQDITADTSVVRGASVIIETSGTMAGLQLALRYAASHARVVLTGCNRVCEEPIDLYQYIHRKGVSMIGAHGQTRPLYNSSAGNFTARRDYVTLLGLMKDGRIHPSDIFSEFAQPENAAQVYDRLLTDREFPLGVVFDWTKY